MHKTKFWDSHRKIDKINHDRKKFYASFLNINCFINVIYVFKEYMKVEYVVDHKRIQQRKKLINYIFSI